MGRFVCVISLPSSVGYQGHDCEAAITLTSHAAMSREGWNTPGVQAILLSEEPKAGKIVGAEP